MNCRLIAMDLDGTLNNDEKKITEQTRRVLMEAQKRGIRLVLASARPSPGLYKEKDLLELGKYGGILMSYNGGRITDAQTGEILFETCMDRSEAAYVLRFLEDLPVTPILDDGRIFYVTDRKGYKVAYECRNNGMDCVEVKNLADFLEFSPVKILMSADPEKIGEIRNRIAENLPERLSVVQTAPFYLEVTPASIHKGQGIREVCRVLGLDPSELIAFGDAQNDISMLREAGIGIAMGNAAQEVKEAADFVTLSNNEDGIAYALRRLGVCREEGADGIAHGLGQC